MRKISTWKVPLNSLSVILPFFFSRYINEKSTASHCPLKYYYCEFHLFQCVYSQIKFTLFVYVDSIFYNPECSQCKF